MAKVTKQSDGEAARLIAQNIRLSEGPGQSLPNMLRVAPLAISLLGEIKLLAFSDQALRIQLQDPVGGFKHLRCVLHILDQLLSISNLNLHELINLLGIGAYRVP